MRVIAGEARGRSLEALPGTDVTRPTLSQVKEAMFSIVQFDLPGARVLDLYAGSGALALEAISRGAQSAVLCDSSREAARVIKANIEALRVQDRARLLPMMDSPAEEAPARRGRAVRPGISGSALSPGYRTGLRANAQRGRAGARRAGGDRACRRCAAQSWAGLPHDRSAQIP